MPHLIKNLEEKFVNQFKKVLSLKTPGMPTFSIVRTMAEKEKIPAEDEKNFSLELECYCFW